MCSSDDLLETSLDVPETILEEQPSPTDAGPSVGKHIPLRSINAVATHVPFIEAAGSKITSEMESMVLEGLAQIASHFGPRFGNERPLISSSFTESVIACDFASDRAQPSTVARSCSESRFRPVVCSRSADQIRFRHVSNLQGAQHKGSSLLGVFDISRD